MKVCLEPNCPVLVNSGRCANHRREREQQRGSSTARGYGTHHQAMRKAWQPKVAAGEVRCARCHQLIRPDEVWDLDHRDDGAGYLGPSHAACNRATAGRN